MMHWYVLHVYSGMEKSVKKAILERVQRANMQDLFGEILVPTEEVIEIKGGSKTVTERRFYPGYILLQMEMTDDSWHLVKNTNKVTGFVGGTGVRPMPVPQREIDKILQQIQQGSDSPKHKVEFEIGELLRVKEGPFADFNGSVEEINYDKNRLIVSVMIFGRATPVDLDFSQVEKT
jgi:transcriptional antiterminator NusG